LTNSNTASQHTLLVHSSKEQKTSQSLHDVSLCLADISHEEKSDSYRGSTPSMSCLSLANLHQSELDKQRIEKNVCNSKYSNLLYENYPIEPKTQIGKKSSYDSIPDFEIVSVPNNSVGDAHLLNKPSVTKSKSLTEHANCTPLNPCEQMKNEKNSRSMSTWLQSNQKLNKLLAFFKRNNESKLSKFKPSMNIKRRALDNKFSLYVTNKSNHADRTVPQIDLRQYSERQNELNDKTLDLYLSTDKYCSRRNAICSRIDKFYFNRQLISYMEHLLREDYIKNFLI
jgi:hypothetical protein